MALDRPEAGCAGVRHIEPFARQQRHRYPDLCPGRQALKPIAGALAETIFVLGVIGTGLLSVPVLAGSAAYSVGEARKQPTGLARKSMEAKAFYAVIASRRLSA